MMEDEPTPVINIISSKIQNQHGLYQAASNREPTPHSNDEPNAASARPMAMKGARLLQSWSPSAAGQAPAAAGQAQTPAGPPALGQQPTACNYDDY